MHAACLVFLLVKFANLTSMLSKKVNVNVPITPPKKKHGLNFLECSYVRSDSNYDLPLVT